MTQEEIIEMARQSGIIAVHTEGDGNWHQQFVALKAFAKLVTEKNVRRVQRCWTNGKNTTGLLRIALPPSEQEAIRKDKPIKKYNG